MKSQESSHGHERSFLVRSFLVLGLVFSLTASAGVAQESGSNKAFGKALTDKTSRAEIKKALTEGRLSGAEGLVGEPQLRDGDLGLILGAILTELPQETDTQGRKNAKELVEAVFERGTSSGKKADRLHAAVCAGRWAAQVMEDPVLAKKWFERAAKIDPEDPSVQAGLEWVAQREKYARDRERDAEELRKSRKGNRS